eukprot:s4797_g3.t1
MPDYATDFICTTPQLGRDFASFVAIPSWVRETSKTAIVIDSTAIGGGTFAAYVNDDITKENVLMCLVLEQPDGLMAYAFGSDRPMRSRQVYPRVQGGVIKIVRSGMVPQWQDELVQRLSEPRRWNPEAALPDPVGRLHTVYQSADDQVVEEIFLQMMKDHLKRVWGQVAVFDGVEQRDQDSVVIFLDLRGVAHFPQWAQIEGENFCPVSYFNDLQIGQPLGWSLMVRGGDPVMEGDTIRVHNGEVLELFLARDPPATEDHMDTDGESGSDADEDGDSSDEQDPLPDSSDFSSGHTPPGGPPRGPPPPQPINRPRSRSPRRLSATDEPVKTISLADHLPQEQFDLTVVAMRMPHTVDELWCLLSPWSGDWMHWSLDGVPMNTAARRAVESARPWQDLIHNLGSSPPMPPSLHIYTDGSACASTGKSGYAVILLLKVGAACAILGVLGEQLLGNEASEWLPLEPAALHAEQVAAAVALLWLMQLRAFIPVIDGHLFVDCLAAGRAITGQWALPNELAVRSHNLELITREMDGVQLQVHHVKSHAGNEWNELADAVAKCVAAGGRAFASPPSSARQAFQSVNLDWVDCTAADPYHNADGSC